MTDVERMRRLEAAGTFASQLAAAINNINHAEDRRTVYLSLMRDMPVDLIEGYANTGDEPKYKLPDAPANPTSENVKAWFEDACKVLAEMLTEKRKAYGDNLSDTQKLLMIFYPEGIPPAAYAEVLVMVRIFDKFKRRANYHRHPDQWTDSENPWQDISGYGMAILYDIARGAIDL